MKTMKKSEPNPQLAFRISSRLKSPEIIPRQLRKEFSKD
jgi:hypothetical protein